MRALLVCEVEQNLTNAESARVKDLLIQALQKSDESKPLVLSGGVHLKVLFVPSDAEAAVLSVEDLEKFQALIDKVNGVVK